ncbi:MAG TPA: MFS transporter [Egibacteraceae bacterium]|nr:MFS transporter [Egibacteraceae bacterium]
MTIAPSEPAVAPLAAPGAIRLGLRANWRQFALLVLINAFVGGMIGLERAVLPVLAEEEFGLASRFAILSFVASFGAAKALTNLLAGHLSDRIGRKGVLVAGWLFALPVPLLLVAAPTWGWVVFANVLLGVNQGLCWSTTVVMKIDIVGPARRGFALGLNEAAGYGAFAVAALASGYIAAAYGPRPYPFLLGLVFAAAGLLLSALFVQESRDHARHESRANGAAAPSRRFGEVLALTTWRDRALSSVSQAGLVNNLNDGIAWGLFPLVFVSAGLGLERVAILAALYPGVWAITQLATGAFSDRLGRKRLIVAGMCLQGVAIALVALTAGFTAWAVAMLLLGIGTAMVYPTLLAAISDVADPAWRASSIGVYRLWRDGGYVVGALVGGLLADTVGLQWTIGAVAALTFASGVLVQVRMYETLRR